MSISLFDFPRLLIHHWSKPWQDCMSAFLTSLWDRSQSMNTVTNYASTLAAFFSDGKYPWEYTRTDIEQFLHLARRYPGRALATGSRNSRLAILSSFYKYAGGYWIERDGESVPLFNQASPCLGIRRGRPAKAHRTISDSDLEKFFSVIDRTTPRGARDFALFSIYLTTSRRLREVTTLLWGDIEHTRGADGREIIYYHFSGKGRSMIDDKSELTPECYESILHYLRLCGRLSEMEADDPIFVALEPYRGMPVDGSPDSHQAWDKFKCIRGDSVWLRCKYYCKKAGIPVEHITPHGFRHNSALARLQSGESLQAISRAMRHSSIAVTATYIQELAGTEDAGAYKVQQRYSRLWQHST